jgi:hypothetical protein
MTSSYRLYYFNDAGQIVGVEQICADCDDGAIDGALPADWKGYAELWRGSRPVRRFNQRPASRCSVPEEDETVSEEQIRSFATRV